MDRAEAIKRLEWLRMVGDNVDSITLGKDDMRHFDVALAAMREQGLLENGKQASEKKASEWISVSERLPEDGVRVLTACDDGVVRLGISKGGFPSVVNRSHRFSDVTHWMPLPEPPED